MTDVATRPSARPAVRWRLCGAILRTSLGERLAYRGDFIFGTAVRFLPIVTQVFLWGAVYQASSVGQTREINGYTYGGMVSYFLLAMVARAFSSMPGLASGIGRDVRDGSIKKVLVQPLDLVGYLFWTRVAHKLVYYLTALLPFVLVFWLCADFLPAWPGASVFAAGCVAMLLGFVVGFLVDTLIGLLSFWFLE
ncbi:MAG: ABC-2 family transporter protein, partial [Planctomycetota bacterium]